MTSLRDWLKKVDSAGELKTISGADNDLEAGFLTAENTKRYGPALLFEQMKGSHPDFRMLTTVLRTPKRISLALNLEPTYDLDEDLVNYLENKPGRWETESPDFEPEIVETGPIFENIKEGNEINLFDIPAPKWHEGDGGQYIGTGCVIILKDPDTGRINLGCYRAMLQTKNTMTLYISPGKHGQLIMKKYHDKGLTCPIAISLGHHPLLLIAATLNVPEHISEYNYAGAMGKCNFPVYRSETSGLLIPADGEIVLEGECPPDEFLPEGPFGEWTGYCAGGRKNAPVVKINKVLYRDNPIALGCSPAARGDQYEVTYWFSLFRSATLKSALEAAGIPGIRGIWAHEIGGGRQFVVVSIRQEYAGQAKQAAYVASQCREGAYAGRYVVVVDDDIDPVDIKEVVWAMCTRTDPEKDIEIIKRAWSSRLDPMPSADTDPEANAYFNSRAIIDACIPFERLGSFPPRNTYSAELSENFLKKWKGAFDW